MPQRMPPGCIEDRDRHGNFRVYYRRKGFLKVRLHGTPWTPEFMAQYDAAKKIAAPVKQGVLARPTLPNTWSWLCLRYFDECTDYKRLDPRTRHVRRQILEATFDELIRPGSDKRFAHMPLAKMNANAVEVLRDRKLATPEAANGRIKATRQVFKWGVVKGYAPLNPAREVSYFKSGSEGFHTWTVEAIRRTSPHWNEGAPCICSLALHRPAAFRRDPVRQTAFQARRADVHTT